MSSEIFLGQCEMHIPIAFGAVPDAGIGCRSQTVPRLGTFERKGTGNPRLVVPRKRPVVFIRHGEVTFPLSPSRSRSAQRSSNGGYGVGNPVEDSKGIVGGPVGAVTVVSFSDGKLGALLKEGLADGQAFWLFRFG